MNGGPRWEPLPKSAEALTPGAEPNAGLVLAVAGTANKEIASCHFSELRRHDPIGGARSHQRDLSPTPQVLVAVYKFSNRR